MKLIELDQDSIRKISIGALTENSKRRFFEFKGRQSCADKAKSKPLPGASAGAFLHGEIKVSDRLVRRVVPIHFTVLQALESPLLKMIENAMTKKSAEVDYSEEQQWEICHVFTAEPRELRRTLKEKGISEIKVQSLILENWSAAQINMTMLAILEQVKRHIETTVKFAGEMEKEGNISFFQEAATDSSKSKA